MSQGYFAVSSPQSQYSVPAQQQPFYQSSEGNMGVYTSSNSLVISGTGRTVYSNPGSPKSVLLGSAHFNQRSGASTATTTTTSYCDSQLPLPVNADTTVVIGDDNHSAYVNAFSSSTLPMSLVMPPQGAGGVPRGGSGGNNSNNSDELPNEVCNSHNSNMEKLRAKILMNQHSVPVMSGGDGSPINPLQGSDVYFREPASIPGTDYSAGSNSHSVDISVLLDSHSMGQCANEDDDSNGISSMVTGLGNGSGEMAMGMGLSPSGSALQLNQGHVFEDEFDTMMRDLMTTDLPPSLGSANDVGFPDPELLKFIDSGDLGMTPTAECLSASISSDFINSFGGMSVQPVQAGQNQQQQQQQFQQQPQQFQPQLPQQSSGFPLVGESVQVQEEQSATGDTLDIIKMMNVPQLKPTTPASLGLKNNVMIPKGHIPSPANAENNNNIRDRKSVV